MSELDRIIERGDATELLRVCLAARAAYERGEVCECADPDLRGDDLMCGDCLRENMGQRERLEIQMRGPHKFEPMRNAEPGSLLAHFCQVCARLDEDERHGDAA